MQIRFESNTEEKELHSCKSHREGDWLVFTCPHCAEYENRINFQTGERISHPVADPTIFHQGTFVPVGLENLEYQPN